MTTTTSKPDSHGFERSPHGRNFILERDGFFISYNPNTRGDPMGAMRDDLCSIFSSKPVGGEETAIVHEGAGRDGRSAFYILCGDYRAQLAALATIDECIAFFLAQPEDTWGGTTDVPEVKQ